MPCVCRGYLELLHSGLDLSVAHVLLAHQVVVHAGLSVAHDEEGAAHLAHLHLLLLRGKALDGLVQSTYQPLPTCFVY